MKRSLPALLLLLAALLLPGSSFGEILEYVDEGGSVLYYKYTSRSGSVVFTDTLQGIPPEYRKGAKIVRKTAAGAGGGGAQRRKTEAAPAPAAPAPVQPAVPAPPALPRQVELPPADGPPLATIIAFASLAVVALGAGLAVASRRRSAPAPVPRAAGHDEHGAEGSDVKAEIRRKVAARDFRGAAELSQSIGKQQEAALLFVQGKDPAAAAKIFESLGNLERAAACYRDAGDHLSAAHACLALKDHATAAAILEQAGEPLKAAEVWASALERGGAAARGPEGQALARRGGALFEQAGRTDRAVALYAKAGLDGEAAALCERAGDFMRAAECHLAAGNLEQAVACIDRCGDPRKGNALLVGHYRGKGMRAEAAACAEKAGDLIQAAEILQEAGEFSQAGALYLKAGFHDEAAESYLRVEDRAGAAAAYAAAGNHLPAAQMLEQLGTDPARAAAWFGQGGDFYAAARNLVKVGRLDEALSALQQVDPAAEEQRRASLLTGMILLKKGMTGPARERFEQIIDGQPVGRANLDPWYFLALCHEAVGERAQARTIFERILAVNYGFRDVKRRLG